MPATLVLLRHGESVWNAENLFTGWHDVELSAKGVEEARRAGVLLREAGVWFDAGYTSVLTRAVQTTHLALTEAGQPWLPIERTWRLNERHYGALQGLDKKATTERHGPEQVKVWRRSYDVPPPAVEGSSPEHPANDRRYRLLAPDALPATECLKDVVARVLPWWHDRAVPQLRAGLVLLVGAHGNSLRALVKHLADIPDDVIPELNIPTGIPFVYTLDDAMRPIPPAASVDPLGIKARSLDPEAAAAGAAAVARQAG